MKTETIEVNDEKLTYLDSGTGQTTLLFIHGAFINKEYWTNQVSHFSKKFRVLAIDLAGHGDSSHNRSDWTGSSFGKDISEFMEKLSLENVILIGHSFGSDVMLETEAINSSRIKGLVEVDHMKNVGVALPQEAIDQLVVGLEANFEATCEQFAKQALISEETDAKLVEKLLADYRNMNPEVGIPLLKNGFNHTDREVALLKGLDRKLYQIHVDYVPTDEEKLKKYLGDNYELHIMEGTCHYPMLENPKKFNALLENILLKIEGEVC